MSTIIRMKMRNGNIDEVETSAEKMKEFVKEYNECYKIGDNIKDKDEVDGKGKIVGLGVGKYGSYVVVILDCDNNCASYSYPSSLTCL